jgi:hypothetical protein
VTIIQGIARRTMSYNMQPPPGSGWAKVRNFGDPDPIPLKLEPSWAREFRLTHAVGFIGAYGWPMRCVSSSTTFQAGGPQPRHIGSVAIPQWAGGLAGVRVPVSPIWLGVAADTLAWTAAWSLPLVGLGFLRRQRRSARGLCIRCGYDLRGSSAACPECGRARMRPQNG